VERLAHGLIAEKIQGHAAYVRAMDKLRRVDLERHGNAHAARGTHGFLAAAGQHRGRGLDLVGREQLPGLETADLLPPLGVGLVYDAPGRIQVALGRFVDRHGLCRHWAYAYMASMLRRAGSGKA